MINWKIRLKNKSFWLGVIGIIVPTIYQFLALFNLTPAVQQEEIIHVAGLIMQVLGAYGVVIDPTTAGTADSQAAQRYTKPRNDKDHIAPEGM